MRRLPGALLVSAVFATSSAAQDAPAALDAVSETAVEREIWAVLSGGSLKATLEGWARIAGWTVVWDNPLDYRLRASAIFEGVFEQAIADLVDAIHQERPELTVTLYRGNQVLHVETLAEFPRRGVDPKQDLR